ncbi:MAG TPA: efflux RND transporter periplasmic adaptor subunit [Acidobacteriota bacterium]
MRPVSMCGPSRARSGRVRLLWPAALGVAWILGAAGCGNQAEDAALDAPRAIPVRAAAVERRDLAETVSLTGTLRPRRQVEVVAEVAARLLEVVRDEGERVAAGETLARLDPTDYRLAYQRAQAALAVAEANRAHAVAEQERAANLLQTGGITDKDHLAAEVNLQVAVASLAEVRASLAIAEQQLGRTEVAAPFGGRIARRHVDPGAMLTAGQRLFTLVDDSVLEFRAAVPSADWGRIRVGDRVALAVDAQSGIASHGRVARIMPLVDERTRAFELVVEVSGGGNLVGGLFARGLVRIGERSGALVVPPAALVRDGAAPGQAELFVVQNGQSQRRTVTLGVETSETIQVTEGVQAGELVILDPPAALGDGMAVEIQNRPGAAKAAAG